MADVHQLVEQDPAQRPGGEAFGEPPRDEDARPHHAPHGRRGEACSGLQQGDRATDPGGPRSSSQSSGSRSGAIGRAERSRRDSRRWLPSRRPIRNETAAAQASMSHADTLESGDPRRRLLPRDHLGGGTRGGCIRDLWG